MKERSEDENSTMAKHKDLGLYSILVTMNTVIMIQGHDDL
jgi:hypothetical protein